METAQTVRAAIRATEWAVSIDIRDAYLHIPRSPTVWKYLRFCISKCTYQITCLPFGVATSLREFTKLLRPVMPMLLLQGVCLHVYLNVWLIQGDSPEMASSHVQLVILSYFIFPTEEQGTGRSTTEIYMRGNSKRVLFGKTGYSVCFRANDFFMRHVDNILFHIVKNKISVFEVYSQQFCHYLVLLFDDDTVASTIISRQTSIASVLRHWKYDPVTDPNVKMLLRGKLVFCFHWLQHA